MNTQKEKNQKQSDMMKLRHELGMYDNAKNSMKKRYFPHKDNPDFVIDLLL